MRRTFLKKLLPKDERKRETVLLIISESAILYFVFLFLYSLINNISINDSNSDKHIILSIVYFTSYTFISYISSEILREDISSGRELVKSVFQSIISNFLIVTIIVIFLIITKYINFNIMNIVITFIIFFVPLNIIKFMELFMSYRANKELFEE